MMKVLMERITTGSNADEYIADDDNDEDDHDDLNRSQHEFQHEHQYQHGEVDNIDVDVDVDVDVEEQTQTSFSTTNNAHSHSHLRVGGYMDMNKMSMNIIEQISSSSEDDVGPSHYPILPLSLNPSATPSMRSTSNDILSSIGTFSKPKHQNTSQQYNYHHRSQCVHPHQSYLPLNQNQNDGKKRSLKPRQCLMFGIKKQLLFWIFMVLTFLNFHQMNNSPNKLPVFDSTYASTDGISTIQVPFPPPHEEKVSVVIMNYFSLPRMIKESNLLPTVVSHPSIDEVILLHTNPKAAFKYIDPKVINIDASREMDHMGLSLQFYFCQLAKNDWVLHVDGDMEFTENALNEILAEFAKNTHRIVGRFGRDRNEEMNRFNGYSSKGTSKETDVILTKFMVMERATCSAFFEYSHLIWEDIVLNNGEGPLWNGADIFMSLVANHVYGGGHRNNYAMDWLDVRSAPEELHDSSSGRQHISNGNIHHGYRFWDFNWYRSILNRNRHYSYRGMLWGEAKDRLATSGPYAKEGG